MSGNPIEEFAKRHNLLVTPILQRESRLVATLTDAFLSIQSSYSKLDEPALSDPAVGILLTMLDRDFEHVEASICALVSGNGSSGEVVARAACEAAVTILYILTGDRIARLRAHFEHYFATVDDQVRKWRQEVQSLQPSDRAFHEACALDRETSNASMRDLILRIFGEPSERWPKQISERYRQLGLGTDYRTIYARLGSETHGDAEETIRYFLGKLHGDEALLEEMALETVNFSRFLIYHAALLYLKASCAYAICYSMPDSRKVLEAAIANIQAEILKIIPDIGAGDLMRS